MSRRGFGNVGEDAAAALLERKGMKILERSYVRRGGEIDLIAQDGSVLVFVEVKRRTSLRYGEPSEAVTRTKQLRILRTANLYLCEKGLTDAPVRFDIVESLPGGLRHIPDAFDATAFSDRFW